MTASEQGLKLLTAECPPIGDDIDQSTITQRPGVTYTRTTVLVPSDRQLLLIPNTIPMPLNSTIAAVLFAPTKATENNNNSTSTNADASISVAAHVSAVVTGDSLSAISSDNRWLEKIISVAAESGSFVALSGAEVAQVRQVQCGLADDRGNEQPNNLVSAEWMESPAVFEVVSPSTDNVDDAATTATPIISFHSEDDGRDDDDQESEACSDVLPNNPGRGVQKPQSQLQQQQQRPKQGSLAAGSKEGGSSTRKRPLEDPGSGDVEKPKKPRNSFFYFRREYHKQKNANGGRTKAKSISGLAAQMWKEMTEEQKEPYKQFAALDTMRYKRENKIYKESIRRDKKKPKTADRLSDTSEAYPEKQSVATRDLASAGLSMVSPPNATPASMSVGLSDSAAAAFDIASFISGVPVEIPADIVHTPSIFNEPMIISAGPPNVASSSEYPVQVAMASADFGNQQALSAVSTAVSFAAASSSPLMYPYASSIVDASNTITLPAYSISRHN
ncbi:hypothetical protein IWW48_003077 [Coemansia sp. RSA 1200]|nr:hypothetical protein IWW48_003077 [Coemansia sp. RSA 1200]